MVLSIGECIIRHQSRAYDLWVRQVKLDAAHMFLMADKAVPGSSEHVLYLAAAVATSPGPTQMLLEVRAPPPLSL